MFCLLNCRRHHFTKLLKPLTQVWRRQGISFAVYLDDGLGAGKNFYMAKRHSLIVHSDLLKCGFIVNEPKSCWEPRQDITWLGYIINTKTNTISATDKRICKLKRSTDEVINTTSSFIHVKQLASVVGQIISLEIAVGNVVRLMTRSTYSVINSCVSWQDNVLLDSLTRAELSFWHSQISNLTCKKLWPDNHILYIQMPLGKPVGRS